MSSSCLPEPSSDCGNNLMANDTGSPVPSGLALFSNQDSEDQLQLARLSRLMSPAAPIGHSATLQIEGGGGFDAGIGSSSMCENLNIVGPESDDQPTAKQKRVARVVMAVAFLLLSMCVVLIVVTLSMSDHIDRMVRQALMRSLSKARSQSNSRLMSELRQWNSGTTNAASEH